MTTRAARWATLQVGRHGRSVAEVAYDLSSDWHTVMDAVVLFGRPLIEDPARFGTVYALGLDETLFARDGPFGRQLWSTQIVDVRRAQLLDVFVGRDAAGPCAWLAAHPDTWRAGIKWATLDLSASYKSVFDTMLPDAVQVADPFHVVKLANQALDECHTAGCRTRPSATGAARVIRSTAAAAVRHGPRAAQHRRHERLLGLLAAGDPKREVWFAWNAKEVVRQIYDHTNEPLAVAWVDEIVRDFADGEMPFEVRRLGRTIARCHQIVAWHRSHVSNRTTEAVNNLVTRVKRVAFGFRRFDHYRIRSLLYAGKPNWTLLNALTPP
jgi:transposase